MKYPHFMLIFNRIFVQSHFGSYCLTVVVYFINAGILLGLEKHARKIHWSLKDYITRYASQLKSLN